ncbi:unnamed protein product [Ectocarpus sp. 12 AP-2014]
MTELGKESDGIGRRPDPFVRTTDDDCDAVWASWPAVQETAITEGSVLVFDIFPSVGNLFVALHSIVKVKFGPRGFDRFSRGGGETYDKPVPGDHPS